MRAHWREYDAFHTSPPCQKFTGYQNINRAMGRENNHPDLIPDTRRVLIETGKPYVIENVQGSTLQTQFILCGHSLGLVRLARHRHFETNFFVPRIPCTHRNQPGLVAVYGEWRSRSIKTTQTNGKKRTPTASSVDVAREAMGIDWMDWDELRQAVPPAYTKYIGPYMLAHILRQVPA